MIEQVFADGIGAMAIIGNTVRIDLVSYDPAQGNASTPPQPVVTKRLIVPIEGFAAMAAKIKEAEKALADLSTRAPTAESEARAPGTAQHVPFP